MEVCRGVCRRNDVAVSRSQHSRVCGCEAVSWQSYGRSLVIFEALVIAV